MIQLCVCLQASVYLQTSPVFLFTFDISDNSNSKNFMQVALYLLIS